jgi:hypothetical protein
MPEADAHGEPRHRVVALDQEGRDADDDQQKAGNEAEIKDPVAAEAGETASRWLDCLGHESRPVAGAVPGTLSLGAPGIIIRRLANRRNGRPQGWKISPEKKVKRAKRRPAVTGSASCKRPQEKTRAAPAGGR